MPPTSETTITPMIEFCLITFDISGIQIADFILQHFAALDDGSGTLEEDPEEAEPEETADQQIDGLLIRRLPG